ncbi:MULTISPECIES: DUF397 domain-containing protein [unclassified Streptomyces]|uniref:DUF397 domain-containing protein n=1 Tax=unclassified Streptomyces TaxID=2593676 RepID=UPI00117FC4FC|nr:MULTISPECIES: DUF397 domain-containing protein [unclassified Streptomyces]TRO62205.1 DUF397 domain-containing protein [Streptomyces sp. IB201691-2A2]
MKTSTREYDLPSTTWFKSSYSAGDGGDCLEIADGHPTRVPVRDSKNPLGPKLKFRAEAWSAFVENLKQD